MTLSQENRPFDSFAVVFDMDGVIFDTEVMVQKCWQVVAERHGIPNVKETCIRALGTNRQTTANIFKEAYGEDFPYWEYKAEMREEFFGPMYGEHLPMKPGVPEFLKRLKEAGIPTAIATSTDRQRVFPELKDAGIFSCFDQIICGDMVTKSKPDPEIYALACSRLGCAPGRCFGIEDSYNGIRSAHSAGLRTIMVPDLLPANDEMRELAEVICEDMNEAAEYIFSGAKKGL